MYKLLNALDRVAKFESAQAHCDIPCSIYDPSTAQIAALTVVRMIDLMEDAGANKADDGVSYLNSMARYVASKEEHASQCKEEIRVIWGDYFKAAHVAEHPEIHDLAHSIMRLAGTCKQSVNRAKGEELVEAVNRFAEIFWSTKGLPVKRHICPYPPSLETVYPDLS